MLVCDPRYPRLCRCSMLKGEEEGAGGAAAPASQNNLIINYLPSHVTEIELRVSRKKSVNEQTKNRCDHPVGTKCTRKKLVCRSRQPGRVVYFIIFFGFLRLCCGPLSFVSDYMHVLCVLRISCESCFFFIRAVRGKQTSTATACQHIPHSYSYYFVSHFEKSYASRGRLHLL